MACQFPEGIRTLEQFSAWFHARREDPATSAGDREWLRAAAWFHVASGRSLDYLRMHWIGKIQGLRFVACLTRGLHWVAHVQLHGRQISVPFTVRSALLLHGLEALLEQIQVDTAPSVEDVAWMCALTQPPADALRTLAPCGDGVEGMSSAAQMAVLALSVRGFLQLEEHRAWLRAASPATRQLVAHGAGLAGSAARLSQLLAEWPQEARGLAVSYLAGVHQSLREDREDGALLGPVLAQPWSEEDWCGLVEQCLYHNYLDACEALLRSRACSLDMLSVMARRYRELEWRGPQVSTRMLDLVAEHARALTAESALAAADLLDRGAWDRLWPRMPARDRALVQQRLGLHVLDRLEMVPYVQSLPVAVDERGASVDSHRA
jgi:hypothetical protein